MIEILGEIATAAFLIAFPLLAIAANFLKHRVVHSSEVRHYLENEMSGAGMMDRRHALVAPADGISRAA